MPRQTDRRVEIWPDVLRIDLLSRLLREHLSSQLEHSPYPNIFCAATSCGDCRFWWIRGFCPRNSRSAIWLINVCRCMQNSVTHHKWSRSCDLHADRRCIHSMKVSRRVRRDRGTLSHSRNNIPTQLVVNSNRIVLALCWKSRTSKTPWGMSEWSNITQCSLDIACKYNTCHFLPFLVSFLRWSGSSGKTWIIFMRFLDAHSVILIIRVPVRIRASSFLFSW